jgi:hypothetical protein
MRFWKLLLPLLASSLCFAAQADRIPGTIDPGRMAVLPGHLHRKALPQFDQGRVESSFPMLEVTLLTMPTPSQQKALSLLVADQQNPKSPNYHKWITPEQYADRFGLSQNDVKKISAWLKSQGLTVVDVARGRNWIVFSGTAGQIESAFRTEIHRYSVDGEMHFANATLPSVPAALSQLATGVRGFDDFHPKPTSARKAANIKSIRPDYFYNGFSSPVDFVAPGDIATIYNLTPLYAAGFDGTGQKLAIAGQTDVYLADLNDFRSGFGLPALSCTASSSGLITACNSSNFVYVLDGTDPGVSPNGDVTEADLDLEWSAATAPGAQIIYVNSNDVFKSYYFAIDQKLAPVISLSYGAPCEFDDNLLPNDEIELKKANSQGITFMNSSGDSGAASCDGPQNTATGNLAIGGLAVSYPASSPEVTAVGGTAITFPGGFSSTFWSTTNGTNGGTAQNPPLPETSWNDDVELGEAFPSQFGSPLQVQQTYAIVQSGGGASNCSVQTSNFSSCVSGFAQPSWQTVTVPGQASARFVPDVSLLGSPNFPGYIFCTPLDQWLRRSTSTASSCAPGGAAGITSALALTDPNSSPPNQPAPTVVGGTSASAPVFAGIVTLLNQYLISKGLQTTAGLSNINLTLYKLAANPSNGVFHQVTSGDNVVYCQGGTPSNFPASYQCPGAPGSIGSIGFQASNADPTTGYNLVTGLGSVDANALFAAWAAAAAPDFQLTAGALNPAPVSAGQSTSSTVTISPITGSTGMVVNFSPSSCTGLPAGATCSFNPQSVTFDGMNSASTVVTISTAANMAPSGPTTITITPTNSAQTSATVSLTVTATNESFTLASTNGATFPVAVGGTATVNVTVGSTNGFINGSNNTTALPLTYTCTGVPSLPTAEIACNIAPGNGQPTSAAAITVSLVTTPKTAMLRPMGASRIFYALLLPGLFGVVFLRGPRARSMRVLSLIVVLGCSTLWLGACGGSSNNVQKNPGTPVGSYAVTISATTGGANPLTASLPITLTVQ